MSNYKLHHNTAYAPGKLMLMGEWSVLESGNPAIAISLNGGIRATIKPHEVFYIEAPSLKISFAATIKQEGHLFYIVPERSLNEEERESIRFIRAALEVVLVYVKELGHELTPFHLSLESDISSIVLPDGTEAKCGFGSSSATVVAIVKAILAGYGIEVDQQVIFKLSSMAHFFGQYGMGSCCDIAVATYDRPIFYKRFDQDWLTRRVNKFLAGKMSLRDIINQHWMCLEITPINLPEDMWICAGFVGKSAPTQKLLAYMEQFKPYFKQPMTSVYAKITEEVMMLRKLLESPLVDMAQVSECVRKNRAWLFLLSHVTKLQFEIPELEKLCEIAKTFDCAAKFSGTGCGDCGFAVCFDSETTQKLMTAWKEEGIIPVAYGRACEPLKLLK